MNGFLKINKLFYKLLKMFIYISLKLLRFVINFRFLVLWTNPRAAACEGTEREISFGASAGLCELSISTREAEQPSPSFHFSRGNLSPHYFRFFLFFPIPFSAFYPLLSHLSVIFFFPSFFLGAAHLFLSSLLRLRFSTYVLCSAMDN